MNGPDFTATIAKLRNRKKRQTLVSDTASSASSNNCCSMTSSTQKGIKILRNFKRVRVGWDKTTRNSVGSTDVAALGIPMGVSIGAVVAQVLEQKSAAGEKMNVDYLSGICILAVRESLGNVFGDKFDKFLTNFEKSFRSTLVTLTLISDVSQNVGEQLRQDGFSGGSCSKWSKLMSEKVDDSACRGATDGLESLLHRSSNGEHGRAESRDSSLGLASKLACQESLPHRNSSEQHVRAENQDRSFGLLSTLAASLDRIEDSRQHNTHVQTDENVKMDLINQLVLHDKRIKQQLACAPASTRSTNAMISTTERSVMEQTHPNDLLETFKISLSMKELEVKERQLEFTSNVFLLERCKLLLDFFKASFKVEKFKNKLQHSRQVELLKKCLDFLVAGLIIMLASLAYGTYVYSHQRIIEATEACSPYTESKSWWMPKSVSTFNSGLQFLNCQIQVFSRMLFSVLMIIAIIFLLIQRSATSHHTMPVTFILLLLGVVCGYAGKFCIDTLGGSGNHWLIYWESLCLLHFFACAFHSTLFLILNGPITIAQRVEHNTAFPYWMRRALFYGTLLFLPLLCGFMPFATPWEWFNHFSRQAFDFVTFADG